MKEDPIGVIEASYQVGLPQEEWMREVLDAAALLLDDGFGTMLYLLHDPENASVGPVVVSRTDDPELLARLLRQGQDYLTQQGPSFAKRVNRPTCATASERVADVVEDFERAPYWREHVHPYGMYDFWSMNIHDPSGEVLGLGAPLKRVRSMTGGERHLWQRLGAHLAAGLRLRLLSGSDRPDAADAVLSVDGELEHAGTRDCARASERRELRRAVRRLGRARGILRRVDPDEAVGLWPGLVAGKYSLVDFVDTDSRRFLLARRNDPSLDRPPGLTRRERQVVYYAGLGHRNKLIAYELGLGASTVATHLQRALRKLGLRSRAELVQLHERLSRADDENLR